MKETSTAIAVFFSPPISPPIDRMYFWQTLNMAKNSITLAKGTPESDLDDYMSMKIAEPAQPPQKETYTQRRIRKEREVSLLFPFVVSSYI